jgi:hypothetical protein
LLEGDLERTPRAGHADSGAPLRARYSPAAPVSEEA